MASAAKYDMAVYPVQVAVRSQSDGAAVHMVTLAHCDCADFTNRKGKVIETADGAAVTVCKHILAALERIGGWHREPEMPTAGMNHSTAFDALRTAGVTMRESSRALREAVRTGHAFAGLPGSGSIPVRHEGGTTDGLFSIELPA